MTEGLNLCKCKTSTNERIYTDRRTWYADRLGQDSQQESTTHARKSYISACLKTIFLARLRIRLPEIQLESIQAKIWQTSAELPKKAAHSRSPQLTYQSFEGKSYSLKKLVMFWELVSKVYRCELILILQKTP